MDKATLLMQFKLIEADIQQRLGMLYKSILDLPDESVSNGSRYKGKRSYMSPYKKGQLHDNIWDVLAEAPAALSITEITEALGLPSASPVRTALKAMEQEGTIRNVGSANHFAYELVEE